MKKTCLILLAHGSPDLRWRAPFEKLTETLRAACGAERVRLAYLEFTSPTLYEAASAAARAGFCHLRILPLFMAGGGHVDRDIPVQVEQLAWELPEVVIDILPPAGEDPRVVAAIGDIVAEALR
jgi:sirohydrochlorin cobaltochelatase